MTTISGLCFQCRVNILAIIVSMIGLQVIIFQFNIYKLWYLNVLEASFIINLLVLAIGTYYVELSGGNQNALTYTSVSVAFATFFGIVVYHSCLRIKGSKLFEKFTNTRNDMISYFEDSEACTPINQGRDQLINQEDIPHTTSFVEVRSQVRNEHMTV